ncbi:MAG: sigma-70 family RNA polymerase sigma factor [Bacilli bacterium]|nr:sigma-70 family RNA polymerase sigma factor [Bacilli bacterium]
MNENLAVVIKKYQNLVYSIVNYFPCNHEDLFQVGCIGLIKAYKNYDKNSNAKFTSYAYTYIWGEIKKYVREDKGFKVSREISSLNYKINQASNLLSQRLMREPTSKELSDYLEIPEHLIIEAINAITPVQSLDEVVTSDDSFSLYEVIPDRVSDLDASIMLKESLAQLPEDERRIIELRYFKDRTQTEIADELNTNQTQISRKEQKILVKLKNSLSA